MKLTTKVCAVLLVTAAALGLPSVLFLTAEPGSVRALPEVRLASLEGLKSAYFTWRAAQRQSGGERNLVIALGWSKVSSMQTTSARGTARFDLAQGFARVDVEGLTEPGAWDVWLVDNVEGPGKSVLPERGDRMHRLGTLLRTGEQATLAARVQAHLFDHFDVDMVVVGPAGSRPEERMLLCGSPTLFQRLNRRESRPTAPSGLPAQLAALFAPRPAFADTPFNSLDPLVAKGADLFFNEKFGGNGRTCATCHPAENNFTLDADFIADLPANDELFVNETNPALAGLENKVLLRQLGLITVNADGFDASHPAVFRAATQLSGLSRYLKPGNQSVPPNQRTGWGGDGAPGGGSLREFPIGAITQHLTKSLDRVPGNDFRLPTDEELDALEAFMLALGRQDNPDIEAIHFNDPGAQKGVELHNNERGQCIICHLNAGANHFIATDQNRNFDIGVGRLIHHPAHLLGQVLPPDGGFGTEPVNDAVTGQFLGFGLAGEVRFNSQPGIESVDTAPFFHDHSVRTIEEATNFYNSKAFKASFAGHLVPIELEPTEVEHVAALLRVLNALENIRSATVLANAALEETDTATSQRLAELASFDAQDGQQVLQERRLHRLAAFRMSRAHLRLKDASHSNSKTQRDFFINRALSMMQLAKEEMVQ